MYFSLNGFLLGRFCCVKQNYSKCIHVPVFSTIFGLASKRLFWKYIGVKIYIYIYIYIFVLLKSC